MQSSETIIVGGGLTGLILAHRLHLAGRQVTLFESRESLGGRYRRQSSSQPFSSPGLDFIPATEENLDLLAWLKNISPTPFYFNRFEHRPQIFSEGQWRPFAGFGQVEFQSIGELSLFNQPYGIDLQPGLEQLVRVLVEQLPVAAHTLSQVTGVTVENGAVTSVKVNGDKAYNAAQVIFTPHPAQLNELFEGDGLPAKHRSRVAKMQGWTAVTLELTHPTPLVEDNAVRLFLHSGKDFEPVVGRVFGQKSKWMTLVNAEREAEHEFTGQCLKHIKRQIKRAWPQAFDGTVEEKIYVQLNAMGSHSLRTKEPYRFPELNNLYLANHCLGSIPGDLAALMVARDLEQAIVGSTIQVLKPDQSLF